MSRYEVVFSDVAEADDAYLRRWLAAAPDEALRWYENLFAQVEGQLSLFPRQYERLPPNSGYEGDVRRMIYGRGAGAYLVYYRVIEPSDEDPDGLVVVLHVLRGARDLSPPAQDSDT